MTEVLNALHGVRGLQSEGQPGLSLKQHKDQATDAFSHEHTKVASLRCGVRETCPVP